MFYFCNPDPYCSHWQTHCILQLNSKRLTVKKIPVLWWLIPTLLQCTPLLTRALFVCLPAFTHRLQYQSAPAPPILRSLALWITGVTRGTFICPALDCVFNMCSSCWTVRSGSELHCPTISLRSTRTSFSAQWKDVGVFTISALGYLKGNIWGSKYRSLPFLLPTSCP